MAKKAQAMRRKNHAAKRAMLTASQTPMLRFRPTSDCSFRIPNASADSTQAARKGAQLLTTSQKFVDSAIKANPEYFRVQDTDYHLQTLALDFWRDYDFQGQRVLFLLPSDALGNSVCTLLFLAAFKERWDCRAIGVFCAQSSTDIFGFAAWLQVYPLWLDRRDLARWDVVIDLGHLPARRDIAFWPVDMEADLLDAFQLPPSTAFAATARPITSERPLKIGLFPLASSPLRTLPIAVTEALIDALKPFGRVTLSLNKWQIQGRLYADALGAETAKDIEIIDAQPSIGALLAAVGQFDFAVFADSGPAHMAKLHRLPGVAIYTSAPGDVLQGRFSNLERYTVDYVGDFCTAPCGLAKIRQTAAGQVGCMGSLQQPVEALPQTPKQQNQAEIRNLLLKRPVPCVQALAAQRQKLTDFVVACLMTHLS